MGGEFRPRKRVVTDRTAVLLSLPIVIIQMVILLIFSLTDPSRAVEIIEQEDGIVTQHIRCEQNSRAFSLVATLYEGLLLLIGCILAYLTRNMDSQYSEAKLLMFSMYNIAFIGIITTVILYTMDIERTGQIVLMAIGVLWGTVFSSAAFVFPRMMRIKSEAEKSSKGRLMIYDSEAFSSKVERATSRVVQENGGAQVEGDGNVAPEIGEDCAQGSSDDDAQEDDAISESGGIPESDDDSSGLGRFEGQ